jgi:hypothetical protein
MIDHCQSMFVELVIISLVYVLAVAMEKLRQERLVMTAMLLLEMDVMLLVRLSQRLFVKSHLQEQVSVLFQIVRMEFLSQQKPVMTEMLSTVMGAQQHAQLS